MQALHGLDRMLLQRIGHGDEAGQCGPVVAQRQRQEHHRLAVLLQRHGLQYDIEWTLSGEPFLTTPGVLLGAIEAAILAETGLRTELSTTGGTSDGRFIAKICPQTIEFGPPNATIHKIDECIRVADIEPLKNIYRRVIETLNADALGH